MKIKKPPKRIHFENLPSTQDYAKERRVDGVPLIVTADKQSGGKGTKDRTFSSLDGGVYLSKLSFFENFPAKDAFLIMARAATAVCKTLRFYGLQPLIKWPNDIWVRDKKICGILIENVFSGDRIVSSVVGIGLNVNNPIPEDLQSIATTMYEQTGKIHPVNEVRERLIAELDKERGMDEYRAYIGYMGRQATLIVGDERIPGTLIAVGDRGDLTVEIAGEHRVLTAAEVSVRLN